MKLSKPDNSKDIKKNLGIFCSEEKGFYYILLFSKTSDENYFRLRGKVPLKKDFRLQIEIGSVVKEEKSKNYLKEAQLSGIVEPEIYSNKGLYWQNVYFPFKVKRKTYIIQFIVSASKTEYLLSIYNRSNNNAKWIIIIVSIVMIIAAVIATIIFMHNYSLLIKNLSQYIEKAAKGDLNVSIKTINDDELNKLANSFNSLIHELKDKSSSEPLSSIFATAVKCLKENNLDDAISLFKTITILRPEGFGSYFNLGVAFAKKKDYRQSLDMFNKALEINPQHELTGKYIRKVEKMRAINNGQRED